MKSLKIREKKTINISVYFDKYIPSKSWKKELILKNDRGNTKGKKKNYRKGIYILFLKFSS